MSEMPREEAIKILNTMGLVLLIQNTIPIKDSENEKAREALRMAISALSVPEREKGEWILKCEFPRRWECSCCHTSSYEPLDRCPKCEADMRGNK